MTKYFIDFNGNVLPILAGGLNAIPEFASNTSSPVAYSIPQWFELSEIQHAHQTILAQIAQKTHMNQQLEREVTLILGMLVSLYIVFHLLYFVLIVACCTQRRISRR
jgi:hypothetical protein